MCQKALLNSKTGLHFADANRQGSFQASLAHCLKTVASSNAQPGYLLS